MWTKSWNLKVGDSVIGWQDDDASHFPNHWEAQPAQVVEEDAAGFAVLAHFSATGEERRSVVNPQHAFFVTDGRRSSDEEPRFHALSRSQIALRRCLRCNR